MAKYNISDEDLSDDSILYDDEQQQQQDTVQQQQINQQQADKDMFADREFLGRDDQDDYFGGGQMELPIERHADLLKDLTDFDSYIKDTVNGWLGRYWDAETEKWKTSAALTPIMNERCAIWCTTFLKTYARKNNIITNIGVDDYRNIVEDIIEVVWLNIGVRYQEFGIKNTGDILRVCTEMQHASELVLMGAGAGKYNSFLMGTYNQNESGNRMQDGNDPRMLHQQQKQGIVQRAKNWLWG